ncbi:WhiB family transcriptional regulator [Mycobacterium sp.]|uniref:WhiB family transcriptional regulator n=1 Tax=Mycobacterium sp. TaxID=1785 RepID=UPI0033408E2D
MLPEPSTAAWDCQLHGPCRGGDAPIFFPRSGSRRGGTEAPAKAVCETCPVIRQCRQYAIDAAEPYGIWGGLTPLERALLTPHSTDRADPTRRDHRRSTPKPIHRSGGALRY